MLNDNPADLKQRRLNIGLLIGNLFSTYPTLIWKGVSDKAQLLDVNIIVFKGSNVNSPNLLNEKNSTTTSFLYDYQSNLVYNLIRPDYLDGIIVVSSIFSQITPQERDSFMKQFSHIPMVSIAIELPDATNILVDNASGIIQIIQHLKDKHGRRNIAFIKGEQYNPETTIRYNSFLKGLNEVGLKYKPELIYDGNFTEYSGKEAVIELLDKRKVDFDAIVASNDNMAMGAMSEMLRRGLKIPGQIAVTGFDNLPESALTSPPLTTISQPIYMQGVKALETIVSMVRKEEVAGIIYLSTDLVFRESCGCEKIPHVFLSEFIPETLERQITQNEFGPYLLEKAQAILEKNVIIGPRYEICYSLLEELIQNIDAMDGPIGIKMTERFKQITAYLEDLDGSYFFWISILRVIVYCWQKSYPNRTGPFLDELIRIIKGNQDKIEEKIKTRQEFIPMYVRNFNEGMLIKQTLEEKFSLLNYHLQDFSINVIYILTFQEALIHEVKSQWNIPEQINVLVSMDKKRQFFEIYPAGKLIKQYEFIKELFLDQTRRCDYYIQSLFFHEYCYGYFLLQIEPGASSSFEYISGMLANTLLIHQINKQKEQSQLEVFKRNQEMENGILMARKIQSQLIPKKSPRESITFLYKPMEQVGGDFFDFLEFRDSNSIGMFVSDVSGHGVAAAFITSMIKSAISQTREQQDNPAGLLLSLNKSLFNQTGGNFVTAFYGIYKAESHKFLYANAGHNMPFIIQAGQLKELASNNRSVPLGVMDNEEMLDTNRAYVNHTISLSAGNKLILYTDGLTEAVREKTDGPDFETALLEQTLLDNVSKPAQTLVEAVYQSLVKFRGSEKFEDDVCLICLDVI